MASATGQSLDSPGEAAVIVYVDKNKPGIAVPKVIHGIRTLVIPTDAASMSAGTEPTTLPQAEGIHLSAEVLRAAAGVQRQFAPQLMADPAFFGVGVTQSYDNPAEAALLVLVDLTKTPRSMPDQVGGLRLRYLRVNRLHVTRSKAVPGDAGAASAPCLRRDPNSDGSASGSLTKDGCPISRSFFARCGIPRLFPLTLDSAEALNRQHRWNPTSREKRARYGAPVLR